MALQVKYYNDTTHAVYSLDSDPTAFAWNNTNASLYAFLFRTDNNTTYIKTGPNATDWTLVGGGNSGAFQTQWVYRPGSGATGPVVYGEFVACFTAVAAVRTANGGDGRYTIFMDESLQNPMPVPAGGYDMAGIELVGIRNNSQGTVIFSDAVTMINLVGIKNLALTKEPGVGTPPISIDNTTPVLQLENVGVGPSTINVTGNTFITLNNNTIVQGDLAGDAAVDIDPGVTLNVIMQGENCQCNLEAFGGDNTTTVSIYVQCTTAVLQPQTLMLGSMPIQQFPPVWQGTGDPNGPAGPAAIGPVFPGSAGARYLDTASGTWFECTNPVTPVWV